MPTPTEQTQTARLTQAGLCVAPCPGLWWSQAEAAGGGEFMDASIVVDQSTNGATNAYGWGSVDSITGQVLDSGPGYINSGPPTAPGSATGLGAYASGNPPWAWWNQPNQMGFETDAQMEQGVVATTVGAVTGFFAWPFVELAGFVATEPAIAETVIPAGWYSLAGASSNAATQLAFYAAQITNGAAPNVLQYALVTIYLLGGSISSGATVTTTQMPNPTPPIQPVCSGFIFGCPK